MTDDEIREAAGGFCFDINECRKRIYKGDNWQSIIHAHLFFDHVLNAFLKDEITEPGHLDLDRMVFAAKLDLCAALGLINDSNKGFLRKVNSLRNSIAHDLVFKITSKHVSQLYEMLDANSKDLVNEQVKEHKSKSTKLHNTLLVSLVLLDIVRQNWAAHRLFMEKRRRGLAAAMDNARRVLDSLDAPGELAKRVDHKGEA